MFSVNYELKVKVKLYLLQAMETYRVVRCQ
jgi:hypothetical protein